jgi:hypothetical protein
MNFVRGMYSSMGGGGGLEKETEKKRFTEADRIREVYF